MKNQLLITAAFVLATFGLTAQTKNINFGVNMLSGRMLKHTSKITIPTPLAQQAVELSYRKQTQGNKVWQHEQIIKVGNTKNPEYTPLTNLVIGTGYTCSASYKIPNVNTKPSG